MSFISSPTRKSGLVMLPVLLVVLVAAASVGRGDAARSTRAGTLTVTGSMHTPRAAHTATLLLDGAVLITGGFAEDAESHPFASAERYDPAQGIFIATGSLTTGRQSHSATLLADGKVLVAGGYDGTYLASAELYDPATGVFTPTGNMAVGRLAPRATLLADGKVLITGETASAEVYDPETGLFAPAGTMTAAPGGHTQTRLADGSVLITGGSAGRRGARGVVAEAEVYDPATGTFRPVGAMTTARHKHAAVLLADGRVLIVGGSDAGDWRGRYDSAEIFDPSTGVFTRTGRLNTPRFKLRTAVTLLADGSVLVAGGAEAVEMFDPQTERFTTIPGRLDAARFFSMATLLQNGHVLITGGYDRRIRSTDRAWLYQP